MSEFRVGEQAVGNETAASRTTAADEVVHDDTKIIETDVCELRTPGAVARRPDIRGAGPELLIYANETPRRQFDTSLSYVKLIGVGYSAGRDQNVRRFESALARSITNLKFQT